MFLEIETTIRVLFFRFCKNIINFHNLVLWATYEQVYSRLFLNYGARVGTEVTLLKESHCWGVLISYYILLIFFKLYIILIFILNHIVFVLGS